MKHILSIVLSCFLIFFLAACASTMDDDSHVSESSEYISKSEFEQLEKRVALLEQNLDIINTSELNTVESNSSSTSGAGLSGHNTSENIQNDTDAGGLYLLDNMSADEIFEECKYCLNNFPYEGQSLEDYSNSFKVTPVNSKDTAKITDWEGNIVVAIIYYFHKDEGSPNHDIIEEFQFHGVDYYMDNKISFSAVGRNNSLPKCVIELRISESNKAVDVYERLLNYLSQKYYKVMESNSETYMDAVGIIKTILSDKTTWDKILFLKMQKMDNYYKIIACKPYDKLE